MLLLNFLEVYESRLFCLNGDVIAFMNASQSGSIRNLKLIGLYPPNSSTLSLCWFILITVKFFCNKSASECLGDYRQIRVQCRCFVPVHDKVGILEKVHPESQGKTV